MLGFFEISHFLNIQRSERNEAGSCLVLAFSVLAERNQQVVIS